MTVFLEEAIKYSAEFAPSVIFGIFSCLAGIFYDRKKDSLGVVVSTLVFSVFISIMIKLITYHWITNGIFVLIITGFFCFNFRASASMMNSFSSFIERIRPSDILKLYLKSKGLKDNEAEKIIDGIESRNEDVCDDRRKDDNSKKSDESKKNDEAKDGNDNKKNEILSAEICEPGTADDVECFKPEDALANTIAMPFTKKNNTLDKIVVIKNRRKYEKVNKLNTIIESRKLITTKDNDGDSNAAS